MNVFEPRYLAMVRAALGGDRVIGMIQPCPCPDKAVPGAAPFYAVGCMGRISAFEETDDGRFLINLRGVSRFRILDHALMPDGYRMARVDFSDYATDVTPSPELPSCLARSCLMEKIKTYLEQEGLYLDWDAAAHVPDNRLYTLLAMVCPFSPAEKQAMLEAGNFEERCQLMKTMLEMACAEKGGAHATPPPC